MHASAFKLNTSEYLKKQTILALGRAISILSLITSFGLSGTAHSFGGYTSAGSRAMADANSRGAYLIAGDRKILLRYNDGEVGVAVTQNTSEEPSIVTGALLDTPPLAEPKQTRAIVCVFRELYELTLRLDSPSEVTKKSLSAPLNLTGARDLRCAVNRQNGLWLAVNIRSGEVLFSNGQLGSLKAFGQNWTHALSLEDRFVVLGENGQAVQVIMAPASSATHLFESIAPPWNDLENRDTLAARGNAILRTGDTQTSLTEFHAESISDQWLEPMRIALSPCAAQGGCGAHLASDGRWIVAGSWGTFVGRGKNFSRIKAPLLNSDATSPGAALNKMNGQYVLVGDIDSDVAQLPEEAQPSRFVAAEKFQKFGPSSSTTNERYVVWKKPANAAPSHSGLKVREEVLFPYRPHSNAETYSGDVVFFNGPLPTVWPEEWVAAEPSVEFQPLALSSEWTPTLPHVPSPPAPSTWWSEKMGFKQAIAFLTKNDVVLATTLVAVIDSGIDPSHEALQAVLHHNRGEIAGNGLDDDNNGLIDDDIGYDFVTEQPAMSDPFGHGTHVAGLINNAWSGSGQLGGATNARIRSFRALDSSGKSNSIDLARAISAAIKSNVDIINCSWGGGPETQVLRDAFAAAQSSQILVFTSAGNDGLKINKAQPVPKNYPGVTPIGAATVQSTRARFSNWGDEIVFGFTPGVEILSTLPNSEYGEKSGTSMASPIAASSSAILLGILKTLRPEWSKQQQAEQALSSLCKSANKLKLQKGFSKCGTLSTDASVKQLFTTLADLR